MDQTTLMTRMVWALQEAEAIKAWLDPRYACHPAAELQARVQASMAAGRDVGLLVIDILGDHQLRRGELQPFAPHAGGGGARPARAAEAGSRAKPVAVAAFGGGGIGIRGRI